VEHVGWVHHSSPSLSCKKWSASLALAVARVHPANLPVREQLNVQIGPTAAAFDRKLGYQVAQKEPAALSLA